MKTDKELRAEFLATWSQDSLLPGCVRDRACRGHDWLSTSLMAGGIVIPIQQCLACRLEWSAFGWRSVGDVAVVLTTCPREPYGWTSTDLPEAGR